MNNLPAKVEKVSIKEITPVQIHYINWWCSHPRNPKTQQEYAKQNNVSAVTLCKWMKNEFCVEYRNQVLDELYRKHEPGLVEFLAEEGGKDWRAAATFLEILRKREVDKKGGIGDTPIVIINNPFTKDE